MGSAAHSHAHSTSPSDFSVNDLNLKVTLLSSLTSHSLLLQPVTFEKQHCIGLCYQNHGRFSFEKSSVQIE